MIIDLVGLKAVITYAPLPTDDPRQRRPDITRAREMLDWQPRIALREGLLRTIAYFDGLLAGTTATTS